jgi:class 3 adenylate cyclase
VWFSDIQGSTALYEHAGDLEAWTRVHAHFSAMREIVASHGGTVVKTLGDAVVAVFGGPEAAARAATDALQNQAGGFRVRIGLDPGPVLAVNGDGSPDVFGQVVNVAARLQSIAAAGEIVTTPEVLRDAAHVFSAWRSVREAVSVRGIERPMEIARLTAP